MHFVREHAGLLIGVSAVAGWALILLANSQLMLIVGLVIFAISFGTLAWRMYQRQRLLHHHVSQAQTGQGESLVDRAKHMRAFQDMFHRH